MRPVFILAAIVLVFQAWFIAEAHVRNRASQYPSDELSLNDDFEISAKPRTRSYHFVVDYIDGSPDGFSKKMIAINGQTPGPLIEANEGDRVLVKVTNKLDVPTSLHFHGLYQSGTPCEDGVPGFSQCPIPPGASFTYEFKVADQYGTFWYHSHTGAQYTDGLYGPFVIHSVNDPWVRGRDFDLEQVLILNDNFHDYANDIVQALVSSEGYEGLFTAPSPQSGLINGQGVYECNKAASGSRCTQKEIPSLEVLAGKTYRLRIINTGSHSQFMFSIDQHELQVIAADGTPVQPHRTHRIPIHNGQRYDALVTFPEAESGNSFYARTLMKTGCIYSLDPNLKPTTFLRLTVSSGATTTFSDPEDRDWSDDEGTTCSDLDDSDLVPKISEDVTADVDPSSVKVFSSHFGGSLQASGASGSYGKFFVSSSGDPNQRKDDISYLAYINAPYLSKVNRGLNINASGVAAVTIEDGTEYADIVINNLDTTLDHPYHLHSVESHIIARGSGSLSYAEWKVASSTFSTKNPLRRDTFVIPRASYAVIRVRADGHAGVWPIHCHIAFHLSEGFMGAMIIHPGEISKMNIPSKVERLCRGTDPSFSEPARKRRRHRAT
ncbi:hypothetical protein IE53DRAFT_377284 [Violaceomyces palustris]|uniref:Uncharacterized protein n=1 Tax=Violaceomyces palustris TaxID=1673888 RepID=A0ACD0P5T7_9BASI|nr:hypothetical protein IE53DRAFT_377284 [Violaceomyces palustris]